MTYRVPKQRTSTGNGTNFTKTKTNMKTKVTTIAALLSTTLLLNLGAFAGPGPQPPVQTRPVSHQQKSVPAPSSKEPTIGVSATRENEVPFSYSANGRVSVPTVKAVSGPHGTQYI